MRKRIKQIGAFVLATVLVCSASMLQEAYAAIAVDTTQTCSLQVNCELQYEYDTTKTPTGIKAKFSEINSDKVTVDLYKVATIDVSGKYTAVEAFEDVEVFSEDAAKKRAFGEWLRPTSPNSYCLDSETPAGDWADAAVALKASLNDGIHPTKTGKSSEVISGLETGLYLIDAQRLITDHYRYEFTPYLISLPNNYYYELEEKANETDPPQALPENADAWVYDLTESNAVGLKPQQFDRYGYLVINKTLSDYNETNPGAVFVFEVKATKEINGSTETVFNDVVALDFTNPGSDSVKVGPIKAGATVTVTEVYQGAGYEKISETYSEDPFVIKAEPIWDDWAKYTEAEKEAKKADLEKVRETDIAVTFVNKHNGDPNGGTGVVNTFKANGDSWSASKEYQSQPEETQPDQGASD